MCVHVSGRLIRQGKLERWRHASACDTPSDNDVDSSTLQRVVINLSRFGDALLAAPEGEAIPLAIVWKDVVHCGSE